MRGFEETTEKFVDGKKVKLARNVGTISLVYSLRHSVILFLSKKFPIKYL